MLIAFIAVVSVQWIWMKYSMREGEARFTSKVYDVLGKAVNLVEQTNNIRLFNDLKERYTQVEEVISTMNHAQDSVLADEDPGNNGISLFSLAFSKGKVGEGQGGNISSMLRIFMNPGGRMGPGYILETDRDYNILYQVMRSATSEAERLADSLERQRMMDLVREFVIRYLREKDPQMAQVEKRLENVDLNPYLKEEMINTGIDNPFTWKIMTREQIVQYIKEKGTKGFYYVELFHNDQTTKDANLCVMFDTRDSLFYNNMGWMFIASGFCIIGLMSVFIITIVIIMRQQKLSVIKNDFIYNMTHEFKTPMTTIAGYTDGILDGTIPPEQEKEYLRIISDEARRLSRLVRRMLEVSQLQSRDLTRTKAPFDVCESMRRVLISMEKKITDRGLVVDADIPDSGIMVLGDNDLITQVIYNLLENAAKFARKGSALYLGVTTLNGKALLSVRNEGDTIPAEEIPLLFERFHKSDKSRSEDKDGVGLGLYVVKTILDQHKEHIAVTSENGLTTFTFSVTLAGGQTAQ